MKRVKNVAVSIVFMIVGLLKLPFTLIGGVTQMIEYLLLIPMIKVAKFGSPWFKDVVNCGMDMNADGCEEIAEFMRDLKIES